VGGVSAGDILGHSPVGRRALVMVSGLRGANARGRLAAGCATFVTAMPAGPEILGTSGRWWNAIGANAAGSAASVDASQGRRWQRDRLTEVDVQSRSGGEFCRFWARPLRPGKPTSGSLSPRWLEAASAPPTQGGRWCGSCNAPGIDVKSSFLADAVNQVVPPRRDAAAAGAPDGSVDAPSSSQDSPRWIQGTSPMVRQSSRTEAWGFRGCCLRDVLRVRSVAFCSRPDGMVARMRHSSERPKRNAVSRSPWLPISMRAWCEIRPVVLPRSGP
jgi:hypothetical protein